MLRFEIPGPIVPYVRVGQERWTKRARDYFASKDNIGLAIKLQMLASGAQPIPDRTAFSLKATFTLPGLYKCDTDNLLKAVLDALQGVVYRDDRYCVRVEAEKKRGKAFALIEVEEVIE